MPPVQPVPGVIRVRFKHTLGDDLDVLDRIYISYIGSPPSVAQLTTYAGQVNASWTTQLSELAGTDVTLTEVIVTDLSSDMAAQGSNATPSTGTRSGGMLPASNATLINFQVSRRYRGGKPRTYMPFGTDTDVLTPQGWSGGYLTTARTQWNAFMLQILADPWAGAGPLTQSSVSYYLGSEAVDSGSGLYQRGKTKSLPRTPPLVDPVISFSINPVFGSQRRRNRPK